MIVPHSIVSSINRSRSRSLSASVYLPLALLCCHLARSFGKRWKKSLLVFVVILSGFVVRFLMAKYASRSRSLSRSSLSPLAPLEETSLHGDPFQWLYRFYSNLYVYFFLYVIMSISTLDAADVALQVECFRQFQLVIMEFLCFVPNAFESRVPIPIPIWSVFEYQAVCQFYIEFICILRE